MLPAFAYSICTIVLCCQVHSLTPKLFSQNDNEDKIQEKDLICYTVQIVFKSYRLSLSPNYS